MVRHGVPLLLISNARMGVASPAFVLEPELAPMTSPPICSRIDAKVVNNHYLELHQSQIINDIPNKSYLGICYLSFVDEEEHCFRAGGMGSPQLIHTSELATLALVISGGALRRARCGSCPTSNLFYSSLSCLHHVFFLMFVSLIKLCQL